MIAAKRAREIPAAEPPVETWWSRRPVAAAIVLAVCLKVFYVLLAAGVAPHLPVDPGMVANNKFISGLVPQSGSAEYRLSGVWQRFDTMWYVHIAGSGYDKPETVVFYPLYPLLIRVVTPVVGSAIQAALLVSFLATLLLFWSLASLVELEFGRSAALRSALILAVWPPSFILFAAYPDSLMIGLMVSAVLWSRRGNMAASAGAAFLGSLAKAAGAFVAIPLLVAAVRERSWKPLAGVVGAGIGAVSYGIYLRANGLPLPNDVYPTYWLIYADFPWRTLQGVGEKLAQGGDLPLFVNLTMLAAVIALCLRGKISAEYLTYSAALVLLFLTKRINPPMQSMSRYLLAVFPVFVTLGQTRMSYALLAVLGIGNVLIALMFWNWWLIV